MNTPGELNEPTFDVERGEWLLEDGRPLASLSQEDLDLLADVGVCAEATDLDRPWVHDWVPLKMAIRKAHLVSGKLTAKKVREAVGELDRWAVEWGLARHGRCFIGEPHSSGFCGVGAYFRIVDVRSFLDKQSLVAAGLHNRAVEPFPERTEAMAPCPLCGINPCMHGAHRV